MVKQRVQRETLGKGEKDAKREAEGCVCVCGGGGGETRERLDPEL